MTLSPILEPVLGGLSPTLGTGVGGRFTKSDRFYFASNRLRTPYLATSVGTAIYNCHRSYLGAAPYATRAYRFALPGHYTDTSNREQLNPSTLNIEGMSFGYGPTNDPTAATWVMCAFSGVDGVTINPAVNPVGALCDELTVSVPANYHRWVAVAFNVASSGSYPRSIRYGPSQSIEGVASSTSVTQKPKLTDGSAITVGAFGANAYAPAYALCRGHDGRPVFLGWGDSLMYGEAETLFTQDTPAWGCFGRGMEDTASSAKMFMGNMGVPGSGPHAWLTAGRNGEFSAGFTTVKKKLDLLALAPNVPFTHIIDEGGTNSTGQTGWTTNFKTTAESFISGCLNAEWPGVPIIRSTIFPRATTTDGFQTTANQTTAFGAGTNIDIFNTAVLAGTVVGVSGYVDPATLLTAPGLPGKWKLDPFSTTLAADYTSGATTIVLTASPPLWEAVLLDPDTAGAAGAANNMVHAISGSGPYTCTMQNSFGYSKTTGAKVTGVIPLDGIHPGKLGAISASPAVIAMKNRLYP